MFGTSLNQSKPAGGGLFGASLNTSTQPASGGLFGTSTQQGQQQQQSGGLFGGLGSNTQQTQQQGGGLFGGMGQNTQSQPQQTGGLFGGSGQSTQQRQQTGGLFGSGLGQSTQQQPQQGGGLFGSLNQSTQQQQQQNNNLFGISQQRSLGQPTQQLGQSTAALWQGSNNPREKSVPDQMATVLQKWDVQHPGCVFKHYFYNKVEDQMAPYYQPAPNEDPKAWEEALSRKPGPGFVPVLCVGFAQLGERIKLQQQNLTTFNMRLHEINNSLTTMMQTHDTSTSVRVLNARRRHVVIKQRCLALATKVQVLKNRGYALSGDEEDLRIKLMALEKTVTDPGLGARGEEIWARMLIVQERARVLRSEIDKSGTESHDMLDEELARRAKKILEDYNTQLGHLKSELEKIQKDYEEWEEEQGPGAVPKEKAAMKNDTQDNLRQFY